MAIPYSTDHGLRNAVLLELAGNVTQAGGVIATTAGETHPNWVLFLNRIITAVNMLTGSSLPTYRSLDYSAFDSVVKAVQAALNTPPVNTVLPAASIVSGGNVAGTAILTCNTGTWTGNPTYTRQWLRNGTSIAGATAITYTSQAADSGMNISCGVVATNAAGQVGATSNAIALT